MVTYLELASGGAYLRKEYKEDPDVVDKEVCQIFPSSALRAVKDVDSKGEPFVEVWADKQLLVTYDLLDNAGNKYNDQAVAEDGDITDIDTLTGMMTAMYSL